MGILCLRFSGITHSVLVRGITPKQRERVQTLSDLVKPEQALADLQAEYAGHKSGKNSLPEVAPIVLGVGLLDLTGAKVGDVVEILSPSMKQQGDLGTYAKFKVIGEYNSGLQHYDNRLGILSLPSAQRLFRMGEVVTGFEVGLKEPDSSKKIAARMREQYPITIKEWQSYNRNIFEAMRNERTVIAFIVALVAFVASFNILTTLFVSVSPKAARHIIIQSARCNESHDIGDFSQAIDVNGFDRE